MSGYANIGACIDRINAFAELEENWDTYVADTIDPFVRGRAAALVIEVERLHGILPEHIEPTCNGNITFEYPNEVEVEVFEDVNEGPYYHVFAGPEVLAQGAFIAADLPKLISL